MFQIETIRKGERRGVSSSSAIPAFSPVVGSALWPVIYPCEIRIIREAGIAKSQLRGPRRADATPLAGGQPTLCNSQDGFSRGSSGTSPSSEAIG